MTDYFALLDQPRRAWLDASALKDEFHRRAKSEHPDHAGTLNETDFAELNAAYRTLANPALRLEHLLQLNGVTASPVSEPTAELADLFFETAAVIQNCGTADSSAALSQVQKLSRVRQATIDSLRVVASADYAALETAHKRLVFLDRWIEQLSNTVSCNMFI